MIVSGVEKNVSLSSPPSKMKSVVSSGLFFLCARYYSAGDLDDRIQFQEMVEFEGRPGPTEAGVFDM